MTQTQLTKLVVLISGNGTNLQAIIDACQSGYLPAKIEAVISNKPDAYGLVRAAQANIPTFTHIKKKEQDRGSYDTQLATLMSPLEPDWIVLAGWMRILTSAFLNTFPGRVINLHPALPGTFPGTHAIERAFEAYQRHEISQTGVMVHLVPDEGVDCGPVLAKDVVPILPTDTLESLENRIHQTEHQLLVKTLKSLI